MLLKASPAFTVLNGHGDSLVGPMLGGSRLRNGGNGAGFVVCAAKGSNNKPLTGVVFEPFEEVKKELDLVPNVPHVSLARQKFTDDCEAAINEQIK